MKLVREYFAQKWISYCLFLIFLRAIVEFRVVKKCFGLAGYSSVNPLHSFLHVALNRSGRCKYYLPCCGFRRDIGRGDKLVRMQRFLWEPDTNKFSRGDRVDSLQEKNESNLKGALSRIFMYLFEKPKYIFVSQETYK